MSEDAFEALTPPDAKRVARRALVLSAVVCRSNSDHDPTNPDAQDLWERLKAWVESLKLGGEIEPQENDLIYAPLGTLDDRLRIRLTWRTEGLAILAWALGLFALPEHDEEVDPYEVTDSLAFLSDEAADVIETAQLRSPAELAACRELLYAIHCRLRGWQRNRLPRDFGDWFEADWLDLLGIESPLGPNGDLRIGDGELATAEEERVNRCEWAVCERHRAIIWLAGERGPLYSQFTVDT